MMDEVKLSGKVVLKKMGKGSKSEHEATYLQTENESYVLRRIGGNAFKDHSLIELEGKNITVKGFINNYTFLIKELSVDEKETLH